ncbi:MAG TPA: hypothetical protein VLT45_03415, partial [Kofleriaceae bacterium]|nr:hypothetical protein [Kofleriaceae bacterium]
MSNTRLAFPLLAALGGCASIVDPSTTSSDGAALSITLAHAPDGIDCISLTFASEDGTVTQVQRAMTYQNVTVDNLASGAYYLSALAYSSGLPAPITDDACGSAPMRGPWGTEEPVPLVLQQGVVTRTSLTLVPTGSVVVHPVFVDTPQVIAQAQGAVGQLAADQGLVAWLVAGSGATGKIVTMNDAPGAVPTVQSSTQTNPSEIVIDPASRAVSWTNAVSGARDSSGHFVIDGSVWTWTGAAPQQVAGSLAPSDLQYGNGTLFWADLATNAIDCAPCTA